MTMTAGRARLSIAPRLRLDPANRPPEGWRAHARCRGMDTEVFYRPDGVSRPVRVAREQAAKAICASCPVKASCLEWAVATAEPAGIWGGLTPEERGVARRVAG